jgi:hypothetical protein
MHSEFLPPTTSSNDRPVILIEGATSFEIFSGPNSSACVAKYQLVDTSFAVGLGQGTDG